MRPVQRVLGIGQGHTTQPKQSFIGYVASARKGSVWVLSLGMRASFGKESNHGIAAGVLYLEAQGFL